MEARGDAATGLPSACLVASAGPDTVSHMLAAAPAPFDTPAGRIVGTVDGDVVRALGIPYAQAERFAPPRPMPPFAGELHASTPSPVAPQPHEEFVDLLLNPIQGIEVDEH